MSPIHCSVKTCSSRCSSSALCFLLASADPAALVVHAGSAVPVVLVVLVAPHLTAEAHMVISIASDSVFVVVVVESSLPVRVSLRSHPAPQGNQAVGAEDRKRCAARTQPGGAGRVSSSEAGSRTSS